MQNLTLQIPDNKLDFFMELVQNLGFVKVDKKTQSILTPRQEQLVRQTIKEVNENPDSLSDWEDVLKRLDPDAC